MTSALRLPHRLLLAVVALLAAAALVPAAASANSGTTYGSTALVLDPGTAAALTSLGVTPGIVAPAAAKADGINFPITNGLGSVLRTGTIRHSGGLTLTAGTTVVRLTDYWINLGSRTLSANVSVDGGPNLGRVAILDLNFRGAGLRLFPALRIGPVTATLTEAAASTLNSVFGTSALSTSTVLGKATVKYRLF